MFKEASELEQISNFYDNITVTWIAMWGWDLPVETGAPPQLQEPLEADIEAILVATEKSMEEAQHRRIYFWRLHGVR